MAAPVLILLVSLQIAAQVSARPKRETAPHEFRPLRMALKNAVDKTICPLNVTLDVDEARIPRVIKTIRCATVRTRHSCCHAHGSGRRASCVELHDDVLVYYPNGVGEGGIRSVRQTVPVGCVCMVREFAEGGTTPDPAALR